MNFGSWLVGVVFLLLFIYVSVALHELGHMLPAKRFGVPVRTYSIGFGPTLFSFERNGTTYALKALPLGGYVHMAGMLPPLPAGRKERWYHRAYREPLTDEEMSRAFWRLATWKKITVMFGGPLVNLILAGISYLVIFSLIGVPMAEPVVAAVNAGSPAAVAGVQQGERVLEVNGSKVNSAEDLVHLMSNSAGQKTRLLLGTDGGSGSTRQVELTPQPAPGSSLNTAPNTTDSGSASGVAGRPGIIGVQLQVADVRLLPWETLGRLGSDVGRTVRVLLNLPGELSQLVSSVAGPGERQGNLVGLVGVASISGRIATVPGAETTDRLRGLLGVFGSLNLALFVFNLVPLLPFDGGHIAGAVWEWLRRRGAKVFRRRDPGPVDISVLWPVTLVVIGAVVALSLVVAWADLVKPVGF